MHANARFVHERPSSMPTISVIELGFLSVLTFATNTVVCTAFWTVATVIRVALNFAGAVVVVVNRGAALEAEDVTA